MPDECYLVVDEQNGPFIASAQEWIDWCLNWSAEEGIITASIIKYCYDEKTDTWSSE